MQAGPARPSSAPCLLLLHSNKSAMNYSGPPLWRVGLLVVTSNQQPGRPASFLQTAAADPGQMNGVLRKRVRCCLFKEVDLSSDPRGTALILGLIRAPLWLVLSLRQQAVTPGPPQLRGSGVTGPPPPRCIACVTLSPSAVACRSAHLSSHSSACGTRDAGLTGLRPRRQQGRSLREAPGQNPFGGLLPLLDASVLLGSRPPPPPPPEEPAGRPPAPSLSPVASPASLSYFERSLRWHWVCLEKPGQPAYV